MPATTVLTATFQMNFGYRGSPLVASPPVMEENLAQVFCGRDLLPVTQPKHRKKQHQS